MSQDERDAAYDKIDRYLRNNLDDADYAEYSAALEALWKFPTEFEQWVARVDGTVTRRAIVRVAAEIGKRRISGGIFIRTVPNVMAVFGCDAERAQRYIDLRSEGYSTEQARLMAGLSDPPECAEGRA